MQLINYPKTRQNDLVVQELPDEVLIYDLKNNKAYCLNHTAAFVWQHSDGQTPVKQIAYLLQKISDLLDSRFAIGALPDKRGGLIEAKCLVCSQIINQDFIGQFLNDQIVLSAFRIVF